MHRQISKQLFLLGYCAVRGCFISYQRIAGRDLFFLKIILQQFCQFFYLLHIGAGIVTLH